MNEHKSALEETIAVLADRLTKIDGPEATEEQKNKAQAYVNNAVEDSRALYSIVSKSSQQLLSSSEYANRFMHTVTTVKREKLSDSLKMFAIGAAAGLAVGLIIWIGDAFIIEFRNVRRANNSKEVM